MKPLQNKKITVMGLGLHGGALGNIKWLLTQRANLTVTDLKTEEQLKKTVAAMKQLPGCQNITLVLGKHREEDFTNADMVIRNPAVSRHSKHLELARAKGIPVEMDSSLFFEHSPSQNIIGVTGSKGKTTTANATAVLLKAVNPQTVAVGIDGISPLAELPNVQPTAPVVFELSSWRLEALDEHRISPAIAVVTSLYKDHLNTYKSFEEYIETKKIIIKHQDQDDIAILNYDDPLVRQWAPEVKGKLYWYSIHELPAGAEGIHVKEGKIEIIGATFMMPPGLSLENLPLHLEHERRNLLPAIFIAHLHGVATEVIAHEIQAIRALPHRLEKVRELEGVTYINDSAATMPDATIAALKALSDRSIVHIIGGGDKQLDFEQLAQAEARAKIRTLVWLPGTATEKMQRALRQSLPNITAKTMPEAVSLAKGLAQPDDVVLLSPGATSFGLFQHEFDRGNQFRQAVLEL